MGVSRRQGHPKERHLKRRSKKRLVRLALAPVSTVKDKTTSTESVQSSGRRSLKPELRRTDFSNRQLPCNSEKWQRQLHSWEKIKKRFNLSDDRYEEFQYLCYLDVENPFIINYFEYHAYGAKVHVKGRIKDAQQFWSTLNPPSWVLDIVKFGVQIPFHTEPPCIMLPNNRSCLEYKDWVQKTIDEFLEYGFIKKSLISQSAFCLCKLIFLVKNCV